MSSGGGETNDCRLLPHCVFPSQQMVAIELIKATEKRGRPSNFVFKSFRRVIFCYCKGVSIEGVALITCFLSLRTCRGETFHSQRCERRRNNRNNRHKNNVSPARGGAAHFPHLQTKQWNVSLGGLIWLPIHNYREAGPFGVACQRRQPDPHYSTNLLMKRSRLPTWIRCLMYTVAL